MDRKTHIAVATCSSGAAAYYYASELAPQQCFVETLGGAVFGGWSGTWPDHLEPSFLLGPHHRGPFHAVAPNTAVWSLYASQLSQIQGWLRSQADDHAAMAANAKTSCEAAIHRILEMFWHLLAGAAVGIPVGYISHIALDALTPMGIKFA